MTNVRFIWAGCLFSAVTSPSHAQTAELRVVGQSTLQAQLSSQPDGSTIVAGRFVDETGSPLPGELRVWGKGRRAIALTPCSEVPQQNARSQVLPIGEDGHFCARLPGGHAQVTVEAQAEHFLPVETQLKNDGAPRLPHPRFTQVPQTLELGQPNPAVVTVLATSGPHPRVAGAELSLSLICSSEIVRIDSVPLAGSKLARFEFLPAQETTPGNCQLEARISAPGHEAEVERRNVLVRGRALLALANTKETDDSVDFHLQARTPSGTPVPDGIVEATSQGAHLASAPVKEGMARLRIERTSAPREVALSYVPSGPAYTPDEPLHVEVGERRIGFRWITLHTVGLTLFCAWIAYAWLKPRRPISTSEVPPRRPLVQGSRQATGPVHGTVRDAHTGEPLSGARLALVLGTVSESEETEVTFSDANGRFAFQTHAEGHPHLRLYATAARYMSLRSPAHGAELSVHMSELRRESVRRLIEWAKRAGRPWSTDEAPTPLEVKDTARFLSRPKEEAWAARVAELAYRRAEPSEEEVRQAASPETFDRSR